MVRQGLMTSKTNSITKDAVHGSNQGVQNPLHTKLSKTIVKGCVIEFSIKGGFIKRVD